MKRRARNKRVIPLLLALSMFACSLEQDPSKKPAPSPPEVRAFAARVNASSEIKCLDVPSVFQGLDRLPADTPVLIVSKNLSLSSSRPIRDNFRRALAAGTFLFESRPRAELTEPRPLKQEGCRSLVFVTANGEETWNISIAERTLIRAESGARVVQYRTLAGRRLEVLTKYEVYDLPCSKSETPLLAELTRVLDWSGQPAEKLWSQSDDLSIAPDYLRWVTEAVGVHVADLSSAPPTADHDDASPTLFPARVAELASRPIQEDVLACRTGPPPPPGTLSEPDDAVAETAP